MNLFVLGINHKTAPVNVREKLSFSDQEIVEANKKLVSKTSLNEGLILSTCNRVEIYGVSNDPDADHFGEIKGFLSDFHQLDPECFEDRLYNYNGDRVIRHLYRVASGLDSMVIGEMEILGQVKKAYHVAKESKTTGKILHRLFQKTFTTAKKIRTDTAITRGLVSVSSVAVKLAGKILGTLVDKEVLVVGAGQIGEQLMMFLKKNGIKSILVANRTFEKAQELAVKFNATAVKFEDFKEGLVESDIVIASTGAPHCLIRKQDVSEFMPRRRQRPLFIIDLAVPRDVESEVNDIDNAYLYDIDDLQGIVEKNIELRKNELENCDKIIADSCDKFLHWLQVEKAIKNDERYVDNRVAFK